MCITFNFYVRCLLIYVNINSSENPGRVSYCPRSNRPLFHINTEVQLKIEFT